MSKVVVFIPYCAEGAQGRELEYAVAGWRRHFKEDYVIAVAGDYHPVTDTGSDITSIRSERVPGLPGQYRQHLDYVSCLKKVRAAFPESSGFVFSADDVYAVNDFDMADILFLKQRASDIDYDPESPNEWRRDAMKTRAALLRDGYPTRDFTTHLPQWYEWEKIVALWERYDMECESYVMEDLYYNIYYRDRIPFQLDAMTDNLKCGIYEASANPVLIDAAFKTKIWINNSPNGWTKRLENALERYFFGV